MQFESTHFKIKMNISFTDKFGIRWMVNYNEQQP